jgi:hypothetical protein
METFHSIPSQDEHTSIVVCLEEARRTSVQASPSLLKFRQADTVSVPHNQLSIYKMAISITTGTELEIIIIILCCGLPSLLPTIRPVLSNQSSEHQKTSGRPTATLLLHSKLPKPV